LLLIATNCQDAHTGTDTRVTRKRQVGTNPPFMMAAIKRTATDTFDRVEGGYTVQGIFASVRKIGVQPFGDLAAQN
jgi:hypothetical protein